MYGDEHRSLLISQTATFIALITVGAWISIPFVPVPLTLQTLFVLLSGTVMKRYGWLPTSLYIILGALNLPVFHNGLAGPGVLLGPTGGYLIGFVPAAFIAGLAYEYGSKATKIAGIVAGTTTIYLFGICWLMYSTGLPLLEAVILGVAPFLAGEVLKMSATYIIAERIQ
jgi:biotin transport system substrate-specific component